MYGSKISTIRLARGYTQDYIAEKLGIKQNQYSKIEKDEKIKVDDSLLKRIADVLGVSIDDIKSPTPVVMNFHNCSYNAPNGTQNNYINEKAMEVLFTQIEIKDKQLAEKDKYIEQLIEKLS